MTIATTVRRALGVALLAGSLLVATSGAGWSEETEDPALRQRIDPDQSVADDEAVLEQGHVDIGPRFDDGTWTLMIHDDTRVAGSVWRDLDRTVLRVSDAALQDVPDDDAYSFLGIEPGTPVHVVPQTQNTEVVWVGWNTQDPEVMRTVDRGATLSLQRVSGPGHLVVYLQDGGFGAPDVLWDSRTSTEQPFFVDVNTHTHANWVFSEPGTYLVEVAASATLVDGQEVSDTRVLRFAVGDDVDPQETMAAAMPAAADDSDAETTEADRVEEPAEQEGVSLPVIAGIAGIGVLLATVLAVIVWRGRAARRKGLTDPVDSAPGGPTA